MAKKRIKTYWLLLLVLLFTASIVTSVGVAQARYVNTVTTPAVVKSPVTGITSNCLVTANDAPRTVLLGQLEPGEPVLVPFWLLSSSADATKELDWGVTNADYADYLSINVFAGFQQLKAEQELELLEDIRLDMILRVEMTETAYTTPHEALKINVHVTWGNEMWGTFQVILPAVAEPETEPPTEAPVEPTGEPTTEPTGEPTTEPTGEPTMEPTGEPTMEPTGEPTMEPTGEPTTEPTGEPTTEPTDEPTTEPTGEPTTEPTGEPTTEPTGEPTMEPTGEPTTEPTGEPTTEPTGEPTTEPTGEPTTEPTGEPTTEPTGEPTTEPTGEPTTEPTEDLDNVPVQLDRIQLKAIPSFNPAGEQLPVMMQLAEEVTSVRLGVQMNYGELAFFEPLPDYTMFSLDGGASYYMIFGDYVPEFGLQNVTTVPLLLNFTYAYLDDVLNTVKPVAADGEKAEEYEELTLAMEAYTGNRMRKCCTIGVIPNVQEAGQAEIRPQNQTAVLTVTDTEEKVEQWPSLILTPEDKLEFSFPADWKDAKVEYTVEFLTLTEEEELKYIEVELSDDGLSAKHYLDEHRNKLVLRLGQDIVQAGTYRIKITWNYEGVCYYDTQTTFFVKNPTGFATAPGGQEVPNDN